jgi:hypothetical protein
MFNFFEQPWTLLIAAVVALYIVFRFRSIFPQKRRWWQWLIPPLLATAAFGLDFFVQTDFEKINELIDRGIKAVEEENPGAIEAIISANYQDSHHDSKEQLMSHCRSELSRSPVEENKKINAQIEISPPKADVVLTVMMKFDKNSYVAQNYKQFFLVKLQLYLQKQPDKKWLICQAELLELDRQQVNWEQIR